MRRWHFEDAPTGLQLNEIADALLHGSVVLLPTDTIYGLHAVAADANAVERIALLKGREETKAFIVLAASIDHLDDLGVTLTRDQGDALRELWPAPLTAVLPLRAPVPASRGALTLAVRVPALDWLRALLTRTGPLVSTSANRSGEPAVDRPGALAPELQDELDVVDAGVRNGKPSAVLDLTGNEPRFIRESDPFFTQKVWKTLRKTL